MLSDSCILKDYAGLFGIKLLKRLRLTFSQLHKHKFRYTFKDKLNLLGSGSTEVHTRT